MSGLAGQGYSVVIVGCGPTGLMLAGELALAGVDVAIVERREGGEVLGTRARGLHARTIEVLDQRGIAGRFLSAGQVAQVAGFGWVRLDISDFPSRHPYGLGLVQERSEAILTQWVGELGVPIRRGAEVTGFVEDESGIEVSLADGTSLRTQYLVGCDGGRSFVRKAAGIDFPGWEPATSSLIAEVEMTGEPEWGLRNDAFGIRALSRLEDGRGIGVLVTEQGTPRTGEATLGDLSAALIAVYGSDYGVHSPRWISRFSDTARQAATYRKGRVLLAGDAAHIHPPIGGQGMNIGMQDAVNLGWKLAQVVKGTSAPDLLDSYHAERHPVATRVLQNTMAQGALLRGDPRSEALRGIVAELLGMEQPRKRIAAMMSGLDVHYDFGAGHPLLGRRMPDLDLVTASGPLRVYGLLHNARPMLIDFGAGGAIALGAWADRVQLVAARYDGSWELPVLGVVPAPRAVLVRPDGHVAWVGDGTAHGLVEALTRWFGKP
jgi:2-polyprenyl-6-methoxyphenol hydroxylase-like FAD-dependent oxidoreductase